MITAKKIIIISSYDDLKNPHYAGGGALAVQTLAKSLTRDYEVCVLTGKYPGCRDEIIDKVSYKRIGTKFFGPQVGQLVFSFLLPFEVMSTKFDLWIESFTPPFSAGFLPVFTRKPVIGLVHMLAAEDMKRKYGLPFELVENFGLKFYKHFIVVSEGLKHRIAKINPKAGIAVIHNGIERINEISLQGQSDYLLYLGRIEIDQKGLDLLLQAFAMVKDKIKHPLYIAGSGDKRQEQKLKALIGSLGLETRVKLIGRVTGEEKQGIYRNAALVVIPSRFETFSIVALEALSFGKPVVTFDIEGFSWLDRDCAVKLKPFSLADLSQTLVDLAAKPEAAREIGSKGWKFAHKFLWTESLEQYDQFIKRVLLMEPYA